MENILHEYFTYQKSSHKGLTEATSFYKFQYSQTLQFYDTIGNIIMKIKKQKMYITSN